MFAENVQCSATRMDGWNKNERRRKFDVREKMSDKEDRKVSKWFGHVERMSGEQLIEKVYKSEVKGRRDRGRPCTR